MGWLQRRVVATDARRAVSAMPQFDAKDKSKFETFSRRSLLVSGGMTAVFAVLVGRLYQLQIVNGDEYLLAAEDNRINQRLIAPPRGRIYDRFGVALAVQPAQLSRAGGARAGAARHGARRSTRSPRSFRSATASARKRAEGRRCEQAVHSGGGRRKPCVGRFRARSISTFRICQACSPTSARPATIRSAPNCRTCSAMSRACRPSDKAQRRRPDDPLMDVPGFRIGKRGIEKGLRPRRARHAPARRASRSTPMAASSARLARQPGAAGRRSLPHHRPRAAALRLRAVEGPKRRLRSARCADGRRAGPGVDARLRSQRLQRRRDAGTMEGCERERPQAADRQGAVGHLSARFDLQADRGGLRPGSGRDHARLSRVRAAAACRSAAACSIAGSAAATARSICAAASSIPATSISTMSRCRTGVDAIHSTALQAGSGCADRHRNPRREERHHSERGMEAGDLS